MRLFLALAVCLSASALSAAKDYTGHRVLRVAIESEDHAKFLRGLEADYTFWDDVPRKGSVDVMVPAPKVPSLEKVLEARGMTFSTAIEDVGSVIAQQRREALRHRALSAKAFPQQGHSMDWIQFHALEDIDGWLDHLEGEIINIDRLSYDCRNRNDASYHF